MAAPGSSLQFAVGIVEFCHIAAVQMGIRYLTQYIIPHGQAVWLQSTAESHGESAKNISSVVIDGPALVFHIYNRLLSWSDERYNIVDAQPSADEVSIAVMQFLLCLVGLGVRIEMIYFDGALPPSKRRVRLERMEGSRQSRQQICRDTAGGFKVSSIRKEPMEIHPRKLFCRRPLHWRFKPMPETAFVVPTVIEDLKYRWSPEEVVRCTAGAPELQNVIAACGDYGIGDGAGGSIFAGRTRVVPGEADPYCAITARETGCAVLTGDSDLLVHDLGAEGSVIFIDSIETGDPLPNYKLTGAGLPGIASIFSIRATQVRPATVAKKLGVPSFQRLAYELNRDSHASFPTIIQRAKGGVGIVEKSANYIAFMKEYDLGGHAAADSCAWISNPHTAIADPRLSELYAQYELPAFAVPGEAANFYLHDLIERHDRRTAWTQGSEFRLIAYSLLNQRYATGGAQGPRKEAVIEHMRKGQRIAPVPLALLDRREVEERLEAFLQQVNLFVSAVYNDDGGGGGGGGDDDDDGNGVCGGSARDPTALWRAFALYDILARMAPDERPSVGQLRRFLERGYCGEKLEWDDIHLHAQRKAVLYSLRMLKDVLAASGETPKPMLGEGLTALISEATGLLRDLPWLRDCPQRTCGIGGDEGGEGPRRVLEGLVLLLKEEGEGEGGQELGVSLVEGPGLLGASSRYLGDRGQLNNASTAGAGEGWIGASELRSSRKGKKKKTRASKGAAREKAPTTAKHATNIYDILRQVD
ncbi:conserved hypothetical protein [Histoplasma capsulatum H143]|uniref:Asteroid domain-containing protein n=1 Tax=Ajellomyces capsulatus (strain H143) TaxID=544712 RepID=C6H585_AJECH|nr:conserved hypothetical protein [Histoplasma capsulatum H143]